MANRSEILLCCPMCNSRIKYCLEEIVMHEKMIDLKTGKLLKKVGKRRVPNNSTRSFIMCVNQNCDFIIDSNEPEYDTEHHHLFELINKSDENEFSKSVN